MDEDRIQELSKSHEVPDMATGSEEVSGSSYTMGAKVRTTVMISLETVKPRNWQVMNNSTLCLRGGTDVERRWSKARRIFRGKEI